MQLFSTVTDETESSMFLESYWAPTYYRLGDWPQLLNSGETFVVTRETNDESLGSSYAFLTNLASAAYLTAQSRSALNPHFYEEKAMALGVRVNHGRTIEIRNF